MERDVPHQDLYKVLQHRNMFSKVEHTDQHYHTDHRNTLGWCSAGYPRLAAEAAAGPEAYVFHQDDQHNVVSPIPAVHHVQVTT